MIRKKRRKDGIWVLGDEAVRILMELQLMTSAYRRNQSRMAQGEAKSGAGGQIAEIHVDHTKWSPMRVKLRGSAAALSRNVQT